MTRSSTLIIGIALASIIMLSSVQVSATAESEKTSIHPREVQAINQIIDILSQNAVRRDGKLVGWEYRTQSDLDGADRIYNGYIVGSAGIGDFLRLAADSGYTSALSLLNETLNHFIDTRLTQGNLSYWYQLAANTNPGWTGSRYGVSGIIRFLTSASSYWKYNATIMHSATDWILSQRTAEGDLPISPGSYFTTGLEYGEAGVIRDLLSAYKATEDSYFLDAAQKILFNFVLRGVSGENSFGKTLKYLWTEFGEGTQFEDLYVTGVDGGNAGILQLFLDYYTITGDENYLVRAQEIGNFLRGSESQGQWKDNSVGYITRAGMNQGLLGYWSGSMSIASTLIKLDRITGAESAARVDALISKLGEPTPAGLANSPAYSGLRQGEVGRGMFYLDLYENYGVHLEDAKRIASNLVIAENGMPVLYNSSNEGYSSNIEEGLAGAGMFLLRSANMTAGIDDVGYQSLVDAADPPTTLAIESTKKNTDLNVMSGMMVFVILYVTKSKFRQSKNN